MRGVDELIESAMAVIWKGYYSSGGGTITPLFSGGHDSLVATYLASQHPNFSGTVHHINTGIGSKYALGFVHMVCELFGWTLVVHKSKSTYETYVTNNGFPGPGRHQFIYNRLKDRCVNEITKGRQWKPLITGCRSAESIRRMGHVEPIQIGDVTKHGPNAGKVYNRKRVWTAPCHDWSKQEQIIFMDEIGLPINKMKLLVGMSGECFCGCYAQPGEIELVREHAPEVGTDIDRLAAIARSNNKPCIWGVRPSGVIQVAETGPMCSSCDIRAAATGIQIIKGKP